jgi:hypothetical protein
MYKNNYQDHSILTTMTSVKHIINNRLNKDNIWSINTEEDYHERKNNYFLYLFVIAITFKLSIFLFTKLPLISPDSNGYIDLANRISNFNLTGYNGERTPGYPLIIAVCNINLKIVVVVQMIMGVLISLLMFKITKVFTANQKMAFIAALTYLFYVPQINIERSILSETTATFFVTASVFFGIVYVLREKLFYKMFLSILLGCFAALTKPIFILLPFFLILIFSVDALYKKEKLRTAVLRLTLLLLITITTITSWSYVNYKNNQIFTYTTLSGLGMTNAVGGFMVPRNDQYKRIRDIYIKHRTIQINKEGTYVLTIFQAFSEMQQETGLSFAQLSMQLQKMSIVEIFKQPIPYIKHVIRSVYIFWKPLGKKDIQRLYYFKNLPSSVGDIVIQITNVLFVIGLPILFLLNRSKKIFDFSRLFLFLGVYLYIWGSSIAQGMVESGIDRYSWPFQPIISCFALVFSFYLFSDGFKASKNAQRESITT